jgi:hypothetical protein
VTQAKIAPDTATIVARSLVAVAVPAGAPKPDISTVGALKRSLLAAKSIVYPDPTKRRSDRNTCRARDRAPSSPPK